jgi:Holliday junction resolvase RusA-like endonuclease
MSRYEIEFSIPLRPVAKGRPRFSTQGGFARAYTPKKTRDYEAQVKAIAQQACGTSRPTANAIGFEFVAFVPIPKSWSKAKQDKARAGLIYPTSRPDLDNYEKAVTDALNGVAFADDSQICDVVKSKRYSDEPRIYVRVFALEGFGE